MMVDLDSRLHPFRPDRAAQYLEGRVAAEKFVAGEPVEIIATIADMRGTPDLAASVTSQALFGEAAECYERRDGWAWIQLSRDHYVGWVLETVLDHPSDPATHRVLPALTFRYARPDMKTPVVDALATNSLVRVVDTAETRGLVYAILQDGTAIVASHLVLPASGFVVDWVDAAEAMIGVPYLWGGRSPLGIDCSGLVQISRYAGGFEAPRDSDMQEDQCGDIAYKDSDETHVPFRRGDLLFWAGHVAIATSETEMVHASGSHMVTLKEPIDGALVRINAQGRPLRSVRRFADDLKG